MAMPSAGEAGSLAGRSICESFGHQLLCPSTPFLGFNHAQHRPCIAAHVQLSAAERGCACREPQELLGCGIPRACSSFASSRPSMVRAWHAWVPHQQVVTVQQHEAALPKEALALLFSQSWCMRVSCCPAEEGTRHAVGLILQPIWHGALGW